MIRKAFGGALLAAGLALAMVYVANNKISASTEKINARLAALSAAHEELAAYADFSDRVIDLPEDGDAYHVSVFTSQRPDARETRLLAMFDNEPELAKLKRQTHWHHYTPASSIISRYTALTAAGYPAVVVQDTAGQVIYKRNGDDVPAVPWPLIRGIRDSIRLHCPHLCPRPCPKPEPKPEPEPEPDIRPIPDIVGPDRTTPPDGRDDTLLVVGLATVGAVVAGFVHAWKKNANGYLGQ